jgi:uncharacterized membrane protein
MLLSQFLTCSHKQRHLVKTNTHKTKQKTKQNKTNPSKKYLDKKFIRQIKHTQFTIKNVFFKMRNVTNT